MERDTSCSWLHSVMLRSWALVQAPPVDLSSWPACRVMKMGLASKVHSTTAPESPGFLLCMGGGASCGLWMGEVESTAVTTVTSQK